MRERKFGYLNKQRTEQRMHSTHTTHNKYMYICVLYTHPILSQLVGILYLKSVCEKSANEGK